MDSRILNMDTLEKELAELQVANREYRSPGQLKKVAPAVPPKRKKAQPQVPQSYNLQTACEPSFSTRLQGSSDVSNKVAPVYSNVVNTNQESLNNKCMKYYTENNNSNRVYSNIPPYESNVDALPPPPPPANMRPLENRYDYNDNVEDIPPPPSPVSSNYSELVRATGTSYHPMMAYPPPMYQHQGYANFEGSQDSSTYESIYEPINPRPNSNLSQRTSSTLFTPFSNGNPNRGRSPVAKEAEVDALTDLLVKSISDKKDADIYGICVKCHETIVGESAGCTAMNQAYHITCFACYECSRNLQGKPFYAVEGQPYCEEDYLNTLEKCSVCMNPILDRILRATGKPYHPSCFACVECGKSLDGVPFTVDATNQIHCIEDFHKKFAPRCCVCKLPIMPEPGQDETVRVVALDRSFHVTCYKCEDCGLVLSSEAEGRGCYPLDNHILCKCCNARRVQMLTNVMTTDL